MTLVYLDANVLITAFESFTEASEQVWQVLKAMECGTLGGLTSQLTLAEVLPKPLANKQPDLVRAYEDLLESRRLFDVMPISAEILGSAARIRSSRPSIKLPDAIHLATARANACNAMFSADRRLSILQALPIVTPAPDCLAQIRALKA